MMQEEKKATEETIEQELSLNDDRRVKVLSPGALVAKRFFRNRLAVVGLTMLVVMFVFSFLGGLISPYGQDEQFYTYTHMDKEYVGVVKNNDLRYTINDGQEFGSILQAQLMLAIGKNADYTMDADGNILSGSDEIGYVSRFVVQAKENGVVISRDFKEKLADAIDSDTKEFIYTDTDGEEYTYTITYKPDSKTWSVLQSKETYVYDRYAGPSKAHWLGTDTNGMDMLTRLMYGGRVSLVIGFIVVFISAFLGILLGGIAGYFGKWVDNLIMRIVDVFYCIPSTPLIIILGAAMDAMQLDPQIRMLYLMLVLGFLGWPSIARLVRGQILSLREQEFMTAAEACGIRASKRIFRHLVPNVIPQLIVTCTMSLGGTIITEATLSFLGLGVKFPFASWGNIINDVNNAYVMTNYWFIWIPAGICLLITVLGFNFVGDGLRDAFDPKMKR